MTPVISKACVIAAPSSGSGKTTVALGLMAALKRRALAVQPFKCGPDFIDPGHHTRVCQRPSRNLDGWMLSADVNRAIFDRHTSTADVSIVEGVMGLFDGARRASGAGSTADMARMLGLPVVLVVDASKMAASAAALVHGFATYDRSVRVAGVILNRVGSTTHYALLEDALARLDDIAVLGFLPHDPELHVLERHLGLVTADESPMPDRTLDHLADLVDQHIDVDRLLRLSAVTRTGADARPLPSPQPSTPPTARIGVACDRAFCFYYEDNLDALRAAGAEIVPFSPLRDRALPADLDALYLGGGYPELCAETLSANHALREDVARFIAAGGFVYAECGGLMYLADAIRTVEGRTWPMVGTLPLTIEMTERSQRFGYVDVTLTRDSLLGPAGTTMRGHSFHYSRIDVDRSRALADIPRSYQVRYTLSELEEAEGFTVGRVLASYIHLHFASNPTLAEELVRRVTRRQPRRASGAPIIPLGGPPPDRRA